MGHAFRVLYLFSQIDSILCPELFGAAGLLAAT